MLDLNEFAKEVHENAVAHGFWEYENIPEKVALIHSEWSEALEEYRAGREAVYEGEGGKPEGWAIELIDGCIRILDFIAYKDEDEDDPLRFADIESFIEEIKLMVIPGNFSERILMLHAITAEFEVEFAMSVVFLWLASEGLDPEALLRKKHDYNKTRPYKHGKKF